MMNSPHQPLPPPKPPHMETLISTDSGQGISPRNLIISPMTDLANNFRAMSSSGSSCDSNSSVCSASGSDGKDRFDKSGCSVTPVRGKKLCFNTTGQTSPSDEELEPDDDAVDLTEPRAIGASEAAQILLQAKSTDQRRFQRQAPYRRKLFTRKEERFNQLRRLNSCGTQSPRLDEKLIGRSKTVEISKGFGAFQPVKRVSPLTARARVATAPPASLNVSLELDAEMQTDKLFEITARARSKSYNRHRSDSSTPLRQRQECSPLRLSKLNHSNSSKMSLADDEPAVRSNGIPLLRQTSTLQENAQVPDFADFFEQFSDDGLGMDDSSEDDVAETTTSTTATLPQNASVSTPTRPTVQPPSLPSSMLKTDFNISPLAAPLLAKKSKATKRAKLANDAKFASPLSMDKLLTGAISKNTRRGLFKEPSVLEMPKSNAGINVSTSFLTSPTAMRPPIRGTSPLKCSPLIKRAGRALKRPTLKSRKLNACSSSPIRGLRLKTRSCAETGYESPRRRARIEEPCTPEKPKKTPEKPRFQSPRKFLSPDTPSKIRMRQRKRRVPYSRAKSMTFSALRQRDPNLPSQNLHQVSACPQQQEEVKRTIERVSSIDNLYLGDHTQRKLTQLATVRGDKHPQLTHISNTALASLLTETPSAESPVKYDIVDCRYPYEYRGGCIESAINIHTEDQLYQRYFSPSKVHEGSTENANSSPFQYPPQDTVLIFHCEFSSERAPRMMKTLREIDRHEHAYPKLKYPELYLLKGGYRDFFEEFPELCKDGYVPMLDRDHADDFEKYRHFRAKSKTWSNNPKAGRSKISGIKQKRKLF